MNKICQRKEELTMNEAMKWLFHRTMTGSTYLQVATLLLIAIALWFCIIREYKNTSKTLNEAGEYNDLY